MPWPNLELAFKDGDVTERGMQCYMCQLQCRKLLNYIHRGLYSPGKEAGKLHSRISLLFETKTLQNTNL